MKKHRLLLACLAVVCSLFVFTSGTLAQVQPVQRDLSVTAVVAPNTSDFFFAFTSEGEDESGPDETITYEITYGASASAGLATNTQIVVDFSGDTTPTGSHVVDYVIGSATNAYGNTTPIINLTNRTITWSIPNLPAGTINQKVSFQLRTNGNYTGTQTIGFMTKTSFSNAYITLPAQTITRFYKYRQNATTPTVTSATTISPTPTVTPSPAPSGPQIRDIEMPSVTDNSATISVTTNPASTVTIRYGTAPNALTKSVQSTGRSLTHLLELKDLEADTMYYFQIMATDAQGARRFSEIVTFQTARESTVPELTNNGIVITSGFQVILSDILNGNNVPFGLITTHSNYALTYTFGRETALKSFDVLVRDRNGNELQAVHLNENQSRVYSASLKSGGTGTYDVFVRLTDNDGNVIEQKVAVLKFMNRIHVLENKINTPIADARIFLSKFNPSKNAFEPLTPMTNPSFTDFNGQLDMILPQGKYRAEISALFYKEKTIEFTLGELDGQEFPVVYLDKDPLNVDALINYVQNLLIDLFSATFASITTLMTSARFNGLMVGVSVGSFVMLGSLLFTFRTDIRWRDLLPFFMFNILFIANKHREVYLYGIVLDNDNPVSRARIEVLDIKTNTVLTHALSNKSGKFAIRNTFKQQHVKFQITKDGFAENELLVPTDTKDLIRIKLELTEHKQNTLAHGVKHTFGELFELILLFTLVAELVFLFNFGIMKTLPFFLLSVLNLLLWIFFQREKKV